MNLKKLFTTFLDLTFKADLEKNFSDIETEFNAMQTGNANAEVGAAHVSSIKSKTFTVLDDRLEESESDVGLLSALQTVVKTSIVNAINSLLSAFNTHTADKVHIGNNPQVRVRGSSQSIANNTATTLAFTIEDFDNDNMHDNVINNSRLTCKTAGLYLITTQHRFAQNTSGFREVDIVLNGSSVIGIATQNPVTGSVTMMEAFTLYKLNVNDYVEVQAYQTSGGALNADASGGYSMIFSMVKVG